VPWSLIRLTRSNSGATPERRCDNSYRRARAEPRRMATRPRRHSPHYRGALSGCIARGRVTQIARLPLQVALLALIAWSCIVAGRRRVA